MREFLGQNPETANTLREDLRALGVEPGMTLTVHSSLSAIGWVVGGAPTVVGALIDALGPRGVLVMPSATPHCGDPQQWSSPKIAEDRLETVRENLPCFDTRTTPTTMGIIAETFRNWPETTRSDHPLESVCARGVSAVEITREHALAFSEGRGTPWEKLYELNSWILLLGVGFNRCTALHFAESLVARRRTKFSRFPLEKEGRRQWVEVPDMADDNDVHFPIIGENYLKSNQARQGRIGQAKSILFPIRDLVDFAVTYFEKTL